MATVTVGFGHVGDFLAELRAAGPNVEPVLRVGRRYRHSKSLPLAHLQVLASFLRRATPGVRVGAIEEAEGPLLVCRLEQHIGQVLTGPGGSGPAEDAEGRAEAVLIQLRAVAAELGLTVRGGVYLGEREAE